MKPARCMPRTRRSRGPLAAAVVAAQLGQVNGVVGVEHRRLGDIVLVTEHTRAHSDSRDCLVCRAQHGVVASVILAGVGQGVALAIDALS